MKKACRKMRSLSLISSHWMYARAHLIHQSARQLHAAAGQPTEASHPRRSQHKDTLYSLKETLYMCLLQNARPTAALTAPKPRALRERVLRVSSYAGCWLRAYAEFSPVDRSTPDHAAVTRSHVGPSVTRMRLAFRAYRRKHSPKHISTEHASTHTIGISKKVVVVVVAAAISPLMVMRIARTRASIYWFGPDSAPNYHATRDLAYAPRTTLKVRARARAYSHMHMQYSMTRAR